MSEQLLPCPFCHCGTNALSISGDEVICGHCGATAELDVWNRRVAPEPSPSHRERAERLANVIDEHCTAHEDYCSFPPEYLASQFAAVAEAATKAERERVLRAVASTGFILRGLAMDELETLWRVRLALSDIGWAARCSSFAADQYHAADEAEHGHIRRYF